MSKYYFSILALSLLWFGCSKIKPSKVIPVQKIKSDSITIWIAESKNKYTSDQKKLSLLLNAYNLAVNAETDSLKANYFSILSYNYPSNRDSSLYRIINRQAIDLNKKINDSLSVAEAYWDLAVFLQSNTVKDSAFYYYSQAQKVFENKDDGRSSGKMYLQMANLQMQIKDYIGSETNTIRAIERFKPLNDEYNLYNCYNLLGIISGDLEEYEKSLAYYNEALYYLRQEKLDIFQEASINNNIGVIYKNSQQYLKAIEYFEEVLRTDSILLKLPNVYALALSNLATTKLYNRDTLKIEESLLKAIEIKRQENQIGSLASSYFSLSEYKAYAQDTISAIKNAKKAEKLSIESNNNERLLKTWSFLAGIDNVNATEYFKKFTTLNDSLQKEERKHQNKFARIRFETDEFIAENVELESEKEVLSKQKQIWTGIAIGFFLLGLAVYIIINQRVKNQRLRFDQQQQANNQEIFNLMLMQKQKVDEVKRLEQKRISEELHDGVLGKMLGARMVLTGLNKRATEEAIKEKSKALGSLQEIEHEIRSISHELSHSAYQKINNFTDSIESLLSAGNKNAKIKTIFNFNEDETWDSLDGIIKINVYRIIQETFQNAIKHANCTIFEITFYRTDDVFNVIMNDNGRGFNINKEKKGIGIRNITSRINKLNGTYHVDSSEGNGTTISLEIPVNKDLINSPDNNMQLKNV